MVEPIELKLSGEQSFQHINYSDITPYLQVRTELHPLSKAELIWLNKAWFQKHWQGEFDQCAQQKVERWLVEAFAVGIPGNFDSDLLDPKSTVIRYADRYGGTDGAPHGGSGRCINIGHFNAKGIGRTALVPDSVAYSYKHGYLELSQAIKQTILSLIADYEFPHGAIPVLAIIDTGFDFDFKQDEEKERCAIVVRPNFLRAAHLERSLMFGSAGHKKSDQYLDAVRVRDVVQYLERNSHLDPNEESIESFLKNWLNIVANQVGYGRIAKLWGDLIVSSNIGLDGAWSDLELFQSLPNWARGVNQVNHTFGNEATSIQNTIRSLRFHLRKYLGLPHYINKEWSSTEVINAQIEFHFRKHTEEFFLPRNLRDKEGLILYNAVRKLYNYEQNFTYDAYHDIFHSSRAASKKMTHRNDFEYRLSEVVCEIYRRNEIPVNLAASVTEKFLKVRPKIYGNSLRKSIEDFINSPEWYECSKKIDQLSEFIQLQISQSPFWKPWKCRDNLTLSARHDG